MQIAGISASLRKSGSRNTMVTSDFSPEVLIRQCHACAVKIVQYNPYLCPSSQNFHILQEIRVEEHDGNIRFKSGMEIWPLRACLMHPAIIIGTTSSLWTWLWGRCHVPQNIFLVIYTIVRVTFYLLTSCVCYLSSKLSKVRCCEALYTVQSLCSASAAFVVIVSH